MDHRLKKIIDNLDRIKIGIDDTFRFHCTRCGRCCINREDILLNPKDIFNLSAGLELSAQELIEKYCEVYIGPDSRIPIVRLLPVGADKRCPFLKERKCSVHKTKPAVCAMYPIGRMLTFDPETQALSKDIKYVFQDPQCGSKSETHTVRSWLSDFDMAAEDEFFVKWQSAAAQVATFNRWITDADVSETVTEALFNAEYGYLYCNYDTSQDFGEQFDKNLDIVFDMIHTLEGDTDE